jgi:hypothetical protein
LDATKRKKVWGLDLWPAKIVTDLYPFKRYSKNFDIVVELVNSSNKVIGREEFQVHGSWTYEVGEYYRDFSNINKVERPRVGISAIGRGVYRARDKKGDQFVRFANVKTDDITDTMTIRFATVNGEAAETAAKKGVLQIRALTKSEFDINANGVFEFGQLSVERYKWADSNIVIPNTILGDQVTAVAKGSKLKLTSVTIPNSVTYIGGSAFSSNKLTSITIPNSVTYIGHSAFSYNKLTNVSIPNRVTYIGIHAFANNNLTNVSIPNSVTRIGDGAFSSNKLTSVTIPNSVTYIERTAFSDNNLTSITIPSSVTQIEEYVLTGNPLTSITIGADVTLDGDLDSEGSSWGSGNFNNFYKNNGRKAGTYTRPDCRENKKNWSYSPSR